ncbi:MAG TPA: serine/threonine-protein kinase [Candidatus Polarisedimenticolia bacterium]|nr:serine/threonine-protein kinase [Candidatus Polarisedimenticolia bacterium]
MGRYLLREPIGRGAFGEVWRAADPHLTRQVAIKILNLPAGMGPRQRDEWEQRFLREARAAGMLSHPGIVTIHDVGVAEDGRPFIVMELVDGVSLDAIIRHGPKPSEQTVLQWGAQVAEALDTAHRRGIVHRDIKPANVLIEKDGRARIADFGIARLSQSELTQTGLFLGSPAFTSPEQIRGAEVDGRSDLFSTGAMLYTLLCGKRPFPGEDLSNVAYAICHVEPVPPRRAAPRLSPECEAVVMKALAKDTRSRYQTGEELASDLRAAAVGLPLTWAVVESSSVETLVEPSRASAGEQGRAKALRARGAARSTAGASSPGGAAALVVALMITLGAVGFGGFLLTHERAVSSSRSQSAGVGPAIVAPAAEPPEHDIWTESAAAEGAVVAVYMTRGSPAGLLTMWSGQRRLLRTQLGASPSTREETDWRIRLPAGQHRFRVELEIGGTGVKLTHEETKMVRGGQSYQVYVRVKSRLSPELELTWVGD